MADNPYRRWYWTQRWRNLAKAQLAAEPLCRLCSAGSLVTAATVCDHLEPHRGVESKFWSGPFQSRWFAATSKQVEHGIGAVQAGDERIGTGCLDGRQ